MPDFIKPSHGRVTSHYQPSRLNPVTHQWKKHSGIDYGSDGSPDIIAAAEGTVKRVATDGRIGYTGGSFGGYGNVIIITHKINGQQYETLYAHLKSVSVKAGQKVKQGQKIGVRGHTGNSTGEHLHFEIHKPSYAAGQPNAIDPRFLVFDPDVAEVQRLLSTAGFKVVVDGIQGDKTLDAIADFQTKYSLTPDGIAGPATMEKLKEVTKPKEAPKVSEQTLSAAQESVRKKAIAMGITDGKNPLTMANQHYVWNVMVSALESRDKKVEELSQEITYLKQEIGKLK